MKRKKNKQWIKRVFVAGLSVAMAVSSFPSTPVQVSAAGKDGTKIVVESTDVNSAGNYELQDSVQGANILHCWNWSYSTIEEHMELIAQCGYTAIQTSPATQPKDYNYSYVDETTGETVTVSGTDDVGKAVGTPGKGGSGNWWKAYQPVTFSVCDNGETWFGTKSELESMCATAEKYGIKVIVDVVANHLGNIKGWQNSLKDVSPQVGKYWNPDMLTDESFWHINDLQIWMSDGREHFTQGTMGMPDLNTADKRVQKYVYEYLDELIDCGVDGFRFDAAKHIETPEDDPSFASDFWPTVLNEATSHYKSKTGGNLYVYGEILNTVGDNFDIANYTKRMSVTDNSAGHHLLESIRNNQAKTLEMKYPADKSVVWAESHDTYMNESSRYASDKSVVRAWAMAGNKNNAASLYFARPYYSKDILDGDNDGQFRNDLDKNLKQAVMGECSTYTWASNEVAAVNHFNNRMAGKADNSGTDGNIAYCQRGNGIVLVNMDGSGDINISAHGLADGKYTDEVTGNTFTVSGGQLSGKIDSVYGVAVVYQNVMPNPSVEYPIVADKPVISATLPSSTITSAREVKFSVTNADSATYSIDAGAEKSFTDTVTLTVGEDKSEGEECVVKIIAKKDGKVSEKTFVYTMGENKPILTISPDSGATFEDTLEVTVSAENAEKASYQIGNEEKVDFSDKKTFTIGENMEEGDSVTIHVTAVGSNGKESSLTATYTKKEETEGSMVYFKNTEGWDKVYAYAWNETVNPIAENGKWPGKEMEIYDAANKIYSIDLGDDSQYNMIIFNNGDSKKSDDLNLSQYGLLYEQSTGKWSAYEVKKPKVTSSLVSGTIEKAIDVTFTVTDAEKATYKLNDQAEKTFTDSVKITVGKELKPKETDTIVIYAENGKKSTTKTYTYTMKDADEKDMRDEVKVTGYSGIYDGSAHSVEISIPNGAKISFSDSETGTYKEQAPQYINAGDYTVYYQVEKEGYAAVKGNVKISIQKKEITVSGIKADIKQYDGTDTATLDFSKVVLKGVISGDQVNVTAKGTFEDSKVGMNKTVTISNMLLTGNDAGNYKLAEKGNQAETVGSIVANPVSPTPTMASMIPSSSVSPTPTMISGTPSSSVSATPAMVSEAPSSSASPAPSSESPSSLPKPTPDGEKPTGSVSPKPTSDVNKIDIANTDITLSKTMFYYNKKVQKPNVNIEGLTKDVDYRVTYSEGCKNVGSYKVTIIGIGAYTGTVKKVFKIGIKKNSVYTVGNYKYKVTDTSSNNRTVAVRGVVKKTMTAITISSNVRIGGVNFKVTSIAPMAFARNKNLKRVTIGSNIKTIEAKAFYGDTKLKKIEIKSKVLKVVKSNAIKGIYGRAVIKVHSGKYRTYKKLFRNKTGFKNTMRILK